MGKYPIMPKPIQLHISTPCHEDWSKMTPDERGRYCTACQKTVVDFTGMIDAEIIRYISRAGSNICGRLLPGQMNRTLVPLSPVQRNGGKGWQFLLAGLMLTTEGSMPHHPAATGSGSSQMAPAPVREDSTDAILMGVLVPQMELDTPAPAKVMEVDTPGIVKGEISVQPIDTALEVKLPGGDGDTIISQIGDRHPCTPADSSLQGYVGGISVQHITPMDTLIRFVKDTLTTLRVLPKQEVKVYPNPINRGSAFHLAWQSEPGTYKVNLLSMTGALIQTRVVQVGSSSQVDTWVMPDGLAAGVYIIQVIPPGHASVFTQKVVVE